MLSDVSKGEAEFVFRETLLGKIHWFEIGGGLGLAHVYGIEAGVGTINIEIFGDKREFAKTYGMGREPLRVALQAIMEWCQVRKLRAFIAAPNVKSRRMARRMGFEEEGLLKQEWLVRNNPTDVWVYGYLGGK
jgi:RimJ/RimL family protein N-acetyltransferase